MNINCVHFDYRKMNTGRWQMQPFCLGKKIVIKKKIMSQYKTIVLDIIFFLQNIIYYYLILILG